MFQLRDREVQAELKVKESVRPARRIFRRLRGGTKDRRELRTALDEGDRNRWRLDANVGLQREYTELKRR